jgi:hypothetical protein
MKHTFTSLIFVFAILSSIVTCTILADPAPAPMVSGTLRSPVQMVIDGKTSQIQFFPGDVVDVITVENERVLARIGGESAWIPKDQINLSPIPANPPSSGHVVGFTSTLSSGGEQHKSSTSLVIKVTHDPHPVGRLLKSVELTGTLNGKPTKTTLPKGTPVMAVQIEPSRVQISNGWGAAWIPRDQVEILAKSTPVSGGPNALQRPLDAPRRVRQPGKPRILIACASMGADFESIQQTFKAEGYIVDAKGFLPNNPRTQVSARDLTFYDVFCMVGFSAALGQNASYPTEIFTEILSNENKMLVVGNSTTPILEIRLAGGDQIGKKQSGARLEKGTVFDPASAGACAIFSWAAIGADKKDDVERFLAAREENDVFVEKTVIPELRKALKSFEERLK